MSLAELRKRAEAVAHDEDCPLLLYMEDSWYQEELNKRYGGKPECACPRAALLEVVDGVEKELRDNVLGQLNEGFHGPGAHGGIYDEQYVNFAHGKLAALLTDAKEDEG